MKDNLSEVAHNYAKVTLENGDKAYDPTKEIDFTNGARWGRKHLSKDSIKRIADLTLEWYNRGFNQCCSVTTYIDRHLNDKEE